MNYCNSNQLRTSNDGQDKTLTRVRGRATKKSLIIRSRQLVGAGRGGLKLISTASQYRSNLTITTIPMVASMVSTHAGKKQKKKS
jgi:hypothetical protein